jgi:hypothetical protein
LEAGTMGSFCSDHAEGYKDPGSKMRFESLTSDQDVKYDYWMQMQNMFHGCKYVYWFSSNILVPVEIVGHASVSLS